MRERIREKKEFSFINPFLLLWDRTRSEERERFLKKEDERERERKKKSVRKGKEKK